MQPFIKPTIALLFFVLISCQPKLDNETFDQANLIIHPVLKPKFDYSILEDGDIVLKRGTGQVSILMIKYLDEKVPLSHCGIIVKEDTSYSVIHSIAKEYTGIDGVQKTTLSYFLSDAKLKDSYIVRHRSPISKRKILKTKALGFLNNQIPFDYDFDIRDTSKFYCSEFIDHALKSTYKKEYFSRKKIGHGEALLLNSLLDTTYFERILN